LYQIILVEFRTHYNFFIIIVTFNMLQGV